MVEGKILKESGESAHLLSVDEKLDVAKPHHWESHKSFSSSFTSFDGMDESDDEDFNIRSHSEMFDGIIEVLSVDDDPINQVRFQNISSCLLCVFHRFQRLRASSKSFASTPCLLLRVSPPLNLRLSHHLLHSIS